MHIVCIYIAQRLCYWRHKTPTTWNPGFGWVKVIEIYTSEFLIIVIIQRKEAK